jgi:hypothetical protein
MVKGGIELMPEEEELFSGKYWEKALPSTRIRNTGRGKKSLGVIEEEDTRRLPAEGERSTCDESLLPWRKIAARGNFSAQIKTTVRAGTGLKHTPPPLRSRI